jgi:hypothetical protein
MTLYQFNALDETGKHQPAWSHVEMVGDRIEGEDRIVLYKYFPFMLRCINGYGMGLCRKCVGIAKNKKSLNFLRPFTVLSGS